MDKTEFHKEHYREALYAIAWKHYIRYGASCSITDMDPIQPASSIRDKALLDNMIQTAKTETLDKVNPSGAADIWSMLRKIEWRYGQKEALDVLADFAEQDPAFGIRSMRKAYKYLLKDITCHPEQIPKMAHNYLEAYLGNPYPTITNNSPKERK